MVQGKWEKNGGKERQLAGRANAVKDGQERMIGERICGNSSDYLMVDHGRYHFSTEIKIGTTRDVE